MPTYASNFQGERHRFADLRAVLACASHRRSGDELAGLAATSDAQRVAARSVLADLPLDTFLHEPLIPYETDEVTRLILDTHDAQAFAALSHLTVGGFRDLLLSYEATPELLAELAPAITPEMAAAVSKLMRNQDLISVASRCHVTTAFRNTQGLPGRLGTRLQPNHPSDDLLGIAAATVDGLLFGVGDAVIGVNPATDSVPNCIALLDMLDAVRCRHDIPTQTCVLTHITNAIESMRRGAPVDLVFQSVAGTEAANTGFGVNLGILREAHEAALALRRGTVGDNVMYFETGQGAALSAGAHGGVDQQTVEARAYAVARAFEPLLVNTVVGFIGPEYLYDGKQIIRAGLEDHFCAKLLGLPMGCDVCYTNHAEADQDDMDTLMTLLTVAGLTFLITVPGSDDVMLNYQSLSFHDMLFLRSQLKVHAAPEFEAWLENMEMKDRTGRIHPLAPQARRLLALNDPDPFSVPRSFPTLDPWARLRAATRARIGLGRVGDALPLQEVLGFQLAHARARDAVHSALDVDAVVQDMAPLRCVVVHSAAPDRTTYLQRPDLGRVLDPGSHRLLVAERQQAESDLAFVVGDGLSPIAVQQHAGALIRASLARLPGWTVAPVIIAQQARVALGDEIGERLGARFVIMLIGERPGLTVANSLGIYVTYAPRVGRRDSERNCISNIHPHGSAYEASADLLAWLLGEAARRKLTGVDLKDDRMAIVSMAAPCLA